MSEPPELRAANQVTAEREAADNAPSPSASPCPDGRRHGCAPGKALPVTFEQWLAGSGLSVVSTGDEQRTGTQILEVVYASGSLKAHVSHDRSVLYEVDCELLAPSGSLVVVNATTRSLLRACAASAVPPDASFTSRSLAWVDKVLAAPDYSRWTCGAIAMQGRSELNLVGVDVFPAADPNACGAF